MGQTVLKTMVIPSTLAEVGPAAQVVVNAAQAAGYTEQALFAIRLALEEAVSNAVRHGNRSDPAKRVTIAYRVDPDAVHVAVTDEGAGFDYQHLPDPTADENLDCPHGRGVMLMRAYMSRVHFNQRGNQVVMVKRRDCPLPA